MASISRQSKQAVSSTEIAERHTPDVLPLQRSGLANDALVREGFSEALQTQIVVPRLGKVNMLFVQFHEMHILVADDVAAPVLDGDIVVPPVLCEAPDYVEWGERMQSKRGLSAFRLHIIRAMRGRSLGDRQVGTA